MRRDGKKGFRVTEDKDGLLKVRANHGHGITGVEVVERELTLEDAITYLMHVTSYAAWSLIRYEGIRRGERSLIHFVARAPQYDEVVAGVRKGGEVSVYVDVGKAMRDGIKGMLFPA